MRLCGRYRWIPYSHSLRFCSAGVQYLPLSQTFYAGEIPACKIPTATVSFCFLIDDCITTCYFVLLLPGQFGPLIDRPTLPAPAGRATPHYTVGIVVEPDQEGLFLIPTYHFVSISCCGPQLPSPLFSACSSTFYLPAFCYYSTRGTILFCDVRTADTI